MKTALLCQDKSAVLLLFDELKSFSETLINMMPENTYERYLHCLDQAKRMLHA